MGLSTKHDSDHQTVRAEPFDVAQDRLVEALYASRRGFDRLSPNGRYRE
jgi:hypothetical protein